ncbi:DUF3592 domain-containing protein [Brachybacterium paraconglomeratum]|uniref:DUF3592 domain-containing protein n=1 Tax=Brachybacterium paraconglomeratum TaxID=173362 RepID=UPI00223BDE39|nr:DUF3592 domain-containing protein [Brachybacterium paraconglomeratum]MCT1437442.1 DUF3592 domain-containing protein [Brachybacterium paraconglomeratum]
MDGVRLGFGAFATLFALVVLLLVLVALWMMFSAVRDLLRARRLASSGMRAEGWVISSHVHYSATRESRSSRVVETIEFTTDRGRTVRANPVVTDAGTGDRSGMSVTVLHDRDRPERFIAPRDGRGISARGPVMRIGFALVFLAVIGIILNGSWMIIGYVPFPWRAAS